MSLEVAVEALRTRLAEIDQEKEQVEAALMALNGQVGKPAKKAVSKPRSERNVNVGRNVLDYLKSTGPQTAAQIAAGTGLEKIQVSAALTAGTKKTPPLYEKQPGKVWAVAVNDAAEYPAA